MVLPGENGAEIEPEALAADDADHGCVRAAQALGKGFERKVFGHEIQCDAGQVGLWQRTPTHLGFAFTHRNSNGLIGQCLGESVGAALQSGGLDLQGIHFWARGYADEYEALRGHPYLEIGATGHYCILLVSLDDPNPGDPVVHYLGHGAFSAERAADYGVPLSRFLAGLKPT